MHNGCTNAADHGCFGASEAPSSEDKLLTSPKFSSTDQARDTLKMGRGWPFKRTIREQLVHSRQIIAQEALQLRSVAIL